MKNSCPAQRRRPRPSPDSDLKPAESNADRFSLHDILHALDVLADGHDTLSSESGALLAAPTGPDTQKERDLHRLLIHHLADPAALPPTLKDNLRRLYGLTTAEASMASALVAGETLTAYAARKDISKETASTHLERIMSKIGARRSPI